MLRLLGRKDRATFGQYRPAPLAILDDDADDELLALLARDCEPQYHWPPPYDVDGEHWWAREQRRNPMPWTAYREALRQEHEARKARAEEQRRIAAEKRARQQAEWERQREEQNRRAAAYAEYAHQQLRQEWIDLLAAEINAARGTRYESLIPNLERDIATIRDAPPGPLPWRLDRAAFHATSLRNRWQIDCEIVNTLPARLRKEIDNGIITASATA